MSDAAFSFFYVWNNYLPLYRKVGGIHWIAIGKLRLAIMWRKSA